MCDNIENNILLGSYELPPFSKIDINDYKPAVMWAISRAKERIEQIISDTTEPTFEGVVAALEFASYELDRVTSILFNLNHAETSEQMQQLAMELTPALTEYANSIFLNIPLFDKVKCVYEKRAEGLTPLQVRVTERLFESFTRHGANLPEQSRERYRIITEKLAKKALQFEQNILAATNNYILHLKEKEQLDGLPSFVVEGAASEAKERGLEGWVISLQAQSMVPFLQYSDRRELREELWRAYASRCYNTKDYSNSEIVRDIVNLRLEKANLLGYPTHADYVLQERMAKSVDRVNNFLDELLDASKECATSDLAKIREFAQKEGFAGEIMGWDFSYYSEKYRKEVLELSEEQLKPYFELSNVMSGLFALCNRLYSITFVEDSTIECYHKDVKAYRVYDDDNKELSTLFIDLFPRATKSSGAWMTTFREYHIFKGEEKNPQVSVVCNFTKPTAVTPSLLTFNEVTTLFHEFGHALHGIFSRSEYPSVSGTNVAWDFVELPSQIMENWAIEREFLQEVALHYQSGEAIPSEYIDRIIASRNFLSGILSLRQLSFGIEDMIFHTLTQPLTEEIRDFELKATEHCRLFPAVEGCCFAVSFSHIFAGGYSAGYYSYKWAEVLEADAYSRFENEGVFNKETAAEFRDKILSKGDSKDALELYIDFMGREPKVEALIKKLALKNIKK